MSAPVNLTNDSVAARENGNTVTIEIVPFPSVRCFAEKNVLHLL